MLFVYIGILHESRFIKEILSFFSNHPEKNIVFFGHGEIDYLVDEYSRNFKNIFLKPMVPLRDISQTLYGADVGFSLLKKNLNHKFTSSNKIFQYLSAKVPVVASTNLEMKKIIKNFNCGWVIERPEKLYSKLSKINKKQIIDKKKKINQIFGTYNWKNEKIKLENFYKNINKIYFKSKKVI